MGMNKAAHFLSLFGCIAGSENKQLHGFMFTPYFFTMI